MIQILLEELIGVATSEKDGLMPSIQRMTTSYQKDQQKYCKIAEFRNRLTGISMLISVLEGLLEINKIINGFTSESFSLHKGESKRIKANGILVICSQYYNLYPSIAVISPATKNIEYIGGYKEYIDGTLFTFTFENDYTTIMTSKIEGVEGSRVPFLIAYQNLLP